MNKSRGWYHSMLKQKCISRVKTSVNQCWWWCWLWWQRHEWEPQLPNIPSLQCLKVELMTIVRSNGCICIWVPIKDHQRTHVAIRPHNIPFFLREKESREKMLVTMVGTLYLACFAGKIRIMNGQPWSIEISISSLVGWCNYFDENWFYRKLLH